MSVILLAAAIVATAPVRDPFWPVGYEGKRHVISAESRRVARQSIGVEGGSLATNGEGRVVSGATGDEESDAAELAARAAVEAARIAAAEEEARKAAEMAERWNAALKSLRFGGSVNMLAGDGQSSGMSVLVNGRARSEGDYVRTDHDGYRFIWRVGRSDAGRKLVLNRVKAISLDEIKEMEKQ